MHFLISLPNSLLFQDIITPILQVWKLRDQMNKKWGCGKDTMFLSFQFCAPPALMTIHFVPKRKVHDYFVTRIPSSST